MTWLLLWGAAGCGYAEQQRALCHPVTGCRPRPFWPDEDGDGWGRYDPQRDLSVIAVDPPEGYVANARDCDDQDPQITAEVAGACPAVLACGARVHGVVGSSVEQVLTQLGSGSAACPHYGALLWVQAEDACAAWGGWLGVDREAIDQVGGWGVPLWVAPSGGRLSSGWADIPRAGALGDGPVLWDPVGQVLRSGADDDRAGPTCTRPTPDPYVYQVPARPR